MESDDDRHPLPDFTFHEACLLTLRLTSQGLPDLHIAPEPSARLTLSFRASSRKSGDSLKDRLD